MSNRPLRVRIKGAKPAILEIYVTKDDAEAKIDHELSDDELGQLDDLLTGTSRKNALGRALAGTWTDHGGVCSVMLHCGTTVHIFNSHDGWQLTREALDGFDAKRPMLMNKDRAKLMVEDLAICLYFGRDSYTTAMATGGRSAHIDFRDKRDTQ